MDWIKIETHIDFYIKSSKVCLICFRSGPFVKVFLTQYDADKKVFCMDDKTFEPKDVDFFMPIDPPSAK